MAVEPTASCWQYLYVHGHCQKEETEDPYYSFNDVHFRGKKMSILEHTLIPPTDSILTTSYTKLYY